MYFMEDPELEKIRQKQLEELMKEQNLNRIVNEAPVLELTSDTFAVRSFTSITIFVKSSLLSLSINNVGSGISGMTSSGDGFGFFPHPIRINDDRIIIINRKFFIIKPY